MGYADILFRLFIQAAVELLLKRNIPGQMEKHTYSKHLERLISLGSDGIDVCDGGEY